MSRVLSFVFLFLAFTASSWAQQETVDRPTESAAKAQELWEKAIAAKGGRERLHAVEGIVITHRGSFRFPWTLFERANTHFVDLYVFPDKLWGWHDLRPSRFGLSVRMYNRAAGQCWLAYEDEPSARDMTGSGKGYSPPSPKATMKGQVWGSNERWFLLRDQLLYLMETRWVRPVLTGVTTERIRRQTVDVIRTEVENYVVYFYLDQKTHLPVLVTIRDAARDLKGRELYAELLGEYSDVAGIQLPGKSGERKLTFEINVDYDPQVFENPPTIAAGPDAWRRGASKPQTKGGTNGQ